MKWNVDASYDPNLPHAAVGGVLRSDTGAFVALFSSPIPKMEINSAKIFAIVRAIKITMSSVKIKHQQIIIESDSLNAVRWCNEECGGPWNLKFPLNFSRNARKSELKISIIHQKRDANMVADSLTKQGLRRDAEFLAWC